MAYRRVPPPPVRLSIWQFELEGESEGYMVKIGFANGDALYVARDKARAWRPDKQLMPQSLRDILATNGDGFSISRGDSSMRSGVVGEHLVLKLRAAKDGWRNKTVFVSSAKITSIRPAARPRTSRPTDLHGKVVSWDTHFSAGGGLSLKARTSK